MCSFSFMTYAAPRVGRSVGKHTLLWLGGSKEKAHKGPWVSEQCFVENNYFVSLKFRELECEGMYEDEGHGGRQLPTHQRKKNIKKSRT